MGIKTLKVFQNDFVVSATDGLEMLTGIDALVQIVENRLKLWLGEWFATPGSGIDYLGLFNQKIFLEKRARIIFKNAVLADPRITKIKKMDIIFDNKQRKLTVDFTAESSEGLISGSVSI